ncbi:hypothetical protein [Rhodopila sp.]|uniref:hypothetical protein n=1 Tax=Rhodopila sp. TaxID=2480087 RepID=UPI003D0B610F
MRRNVVWLNRWAKPTPAWRPSDRGGWLAVAARIAPAVPGWLRAGVAALLCDPAADSDALLLLADALEEAAGVAEACGERVLCLQLRALAGLPRMRVPSRVVAAAQGGVVACFARYERS